MQPKIYAQKHAAQCFLNSLLREWNGFSYDQESSAMVAFLTPGERLILPLKTYSLVGRHQYAGDFYYQKNEDKLLSLEFNQLVELLLSHLSQKYSASADQKEVFKKRISESSSNIAFSLERRESELKALYEKESINFKEAEQALVVGHSFHPHPKNRDGFTKEDLISFSPETRGEFLLHWFLVKPDILHSHASAHFKDKTWSEEMLLRSFGENETIKEKRAQGYIPYPVHPWQKKIILGLSCIKEYLAKDWIIDLGEGLQKDETWIPTSSLRSIYNHRSAYMLKFSLSVRLTNSIRHLLPQEVVRGLQVMDVFHAKEGKEFLKKYPDFHILYEPAFMALIDDEKKILNETIVSLRMNPFSQNSKANVLATLTQEHPYSGISLIGKNLHALAKKSGEKLSILSRQWFEKYLDVAVKPLLMAQANYGVLLGAHQQNLILELKDHYPVASFFRDCQGTGYSQIGFDLFSRDVDLLTYKNGNILDAKMGNTLFSYYLIINSTFNTLAAIASEGEISERELLSILRERLKEWKSEGVRDTSCFDYLLESETILQKGNFLCSFINLNENTTENPLGIYNPIPNPLYEKKL